MMCHASRGANPRIQIPDIGYHLRMTGDPKRHAAALRFIFVTVLIDMLAFGMIIPVLPVLVQDFAGGSAARGAEIYGLFGTAWALMQLFFSPVQGSLSDHFGRRSVILISCAGLGLDFILMALAPNLWWLLVGRIISGITAASFSTAGAYISDITARKSARRASGSSVQRLASAS
jgi:MFS transporter, DHA1 family, tetracycline resistance protein